MDIFPPSTEKYEITYQSRSNGTHSLNCSTDSLIHTMQVLMKSHMKIIKVKLLQK